MKSLGVEGKAVPAGGVGLGRKIALGLGAVVALAVAVAILQPGPAGSAALRQGLLDVLKDPDGAEFRNEDLVDQAGDGKYLLCGEVNAKNGFGGFTGFRRYISTPGMALVDDGTPVFEMVWLKSCKAS